MRLTASAAIGALLSRLQHLLQVTSQKVVRRRQRQAEFGEAHDAGEVVAEVMAKPSCDDRRLFQAPLEISRRLHAPANQGLAGEHP